ncbi:MAG: T9SS type A sorting domain-containing protein [candidate division WOR-3 bacterium]
MIPRELYQAAHKVTLPVKNPNNNGVCLAGFSIYWKPEGKTSGGPQDIGTMPLNSEKIMLNVYPNPTKSSLTIQYNLPKAGYVNISLYDVSGRLIDVLVKDILSVGSHSITFDTANLAQGIYFVKLTSEEQSTMKKIILMR